MLEETFTCGVPFSKFGFLPKIVHEMGLELVAGCKISVQNYRIQKRVLLLREVRRTCLTLLVSHPIILLLLPLE